MQLRARRHGTTRLVQFCCQPLPVQNGAKRFPVKVQLRPSRGCLSAVVLPFRQLVESRADQHCC